MNQFTEGWSACSTAVPTRLGILRKKHPPEFGGSSVARDAGFTQGIQPAPSWKYAYSCEFYNLQAPTDTTDERLPVQDCASPAHECVPSEMATDALQVGAPPGFLQKWLPCTRELRLERDNRVLITLTYCAALGALGLCIASFGPVLLHLAVQTDATLSHTGFVLAARSAGYLLGSFSGPLCECRAIRSYQSAALVHGSGSLPCNRSTPRLAPLLCVPARPLLQTTSCPATICWAPP